MIGDWIGPPQVAAALVLLQRAVEEIHSRRNTTALLAAGAREEGAGYYPVVAVTHLAWIASVFALISAHARPIWPLIGVFLLLQAARYWVIISLGRYWTHRIITLDGAPRIAAGPYRYLRHPNYAITIAETLLLPLCFSAVALGLIMTAIWTAVLSYKIKLEDAALAARKP